MPEESAPDRSRADSVVRHRGLLSALLILHWGAVAWFVLPVSREALDPLPNWMQPAAAVVPPVVRLASPVAVPWLNLTATRQTWTLFAPDPAAWTNSVRVVPYFAAGPGEWVADTLALRNPDEVPYPHLLHHRSYRVLWNLGYASWGAWYRPLFAREMCRTLHDLDGRTPQGVVLLNRWYPIELPWAPDGRTVYDQGMGGFTCAAFQGAARDAWPPYGLPDPVDTRGWPRVDAPADTAATSQAAPGTVAGPAPGGEP